MRIWATVVVDGRHVMPEHVGAMLWALPPEFRQRESHVSDSGACSARLTYRARSLDAAIEMCEEALRTAVAESGLDSSTAVHWTLTPVRRFVAPRGRLGAGGVIRPTDGRGGPSRVREPRPSGPDDFPPAAEALELPTD